MTDPLVRIEAARLREKLREYYEGDGKNDPWCPRNRGRRPKPTSSHNPAELFRLVVCCLPRSGNQVGVLGLRTMF